MGIKDVNILEQHVEKIVIGVAAAGALFMGYLSMQKVTISGTEIGPNDVETEISRAIDNMDATATANADPNKQPNVTVPNYPNLYKNLAGGDPLAKDLLTLQVVIGPKNLPPGTVGPTSDIETMKVVTPGPVSPLKDHVRAFAWQQPVAMLEPPIMTTGAAGGAGGVPPNPIPGTDPTQMGVTLPTRDQSAAVVEGIIPVGQMLLDIFSQKEAKARLTDPDRQKSVIYKAHVQRHEYINGSWTTWEDVKPTKAYPASPEVNWTALDDGALLPTMGQLEEAFKRIALPDFYLDEKGVPILPPILTNPIPKDVYDQMQKLEKDIAAARATWASAGGGATGMGGVGGLGGMGGVAPPVPTSGGGIGGVGGVPSNQPMWPTDAAQMKNLPVVPFTVWDENVKPDHTYQYQVRVEMVNPTLNWQFGLADPKWKTVGTLDSPWIITAQVRIHSDLVFYVTGSTTIAGVKGISAKVYKMTQGKWYLNSNIEALPGMNIAGKIPIPNSANPPLEVDTQYTVVDVQEKGGTIQVVLKDPTGILVTRDAGADRERDKVDGLMNKIQKAVGAATTQLGADGQPIPPGMTTPPPPMPIPPAPTPARGPRGD